MDTIKLYMDDIRQFPLVDRAEEWFRKYGDWIVFGSRMLPVVRTFISIPAGFSRMNFWRFSIFTFAGAFPWSLGLAYGGFLLGENWEQLRSAMRPFDIPILVIGVAAAAWFFYRRIKTIKAQSRLEQGPNTAPASDDDD